MLKFEYDLTVVEINPIQGIYQARPGNFLASIFCFIHIDFADQSPGHSGRCGFHELHDLRDFGADIIYR
jgi:hypothetical protein